ncbi:MAG: hypothetical protein H0X66_16030 [Verrucomicrobia bacterium]|nr:hypothetical protein [Verrucomicrobiota bacterium]
MTPRIGYVYPAGGRQGTSFQVTIGGQYLDGATNVFISGNAVQATVIEHVKPITQGQFNKLRDAAKELQDKKRSTFRGAQSSTNITTWTAEDDKRAEELKKQIAIFLKRPMNPAIGETVTLKVTMLLNAEPGERELRVGTPDGLSNPLFFHVGQLPEFTRKRTELVDEPLTFTQLRNREDTKAVPPNEMNIRIPAVVNGQILPGGRDRFHFSATHGQHLVIVVSARQLIPYLPDAVPGWFQATIALYDSNGKELAYDDDFRFHPDPVLHYEIPSDGRYTIEIRDALYRGREDFVYRITLGELPYVTSIFPLGGKVGASTTVALKGWNLPLASVAQESDTAGLHSIHVRNKQLVSNHVPFTVDTLPEMLEREPNNSPEDPQPVTLPIIINGRMDQPGDWDVFQIQGRAGEEIVAEVQARRLNSPLDSVLKLIDANGRQIAFNDDHDDKGSGLNTHHADSYLRAALPENGAYTLHLGDVQARGGAEYAYRLRISAPRPDFELRVAPSTVNVRGGANVPLTLYALRKDGFTNEIALSLIDANGFLLGGGRIPANQDEVRVTLTAPTASSDKNFKLLISGSALSHGQTIFRLAIPAEDMMQAFAYRHLVPAQELNVAVSSRYTQKWSVKPFTQVIIPMGGTTKLRISTPYNPKQTLSLELNDPPDGLTIEDISFDRNGAEIVLRSDADTAKPVEGNLIMGVFLKKTDDSKTNSSRGNKRLAPLGILPAIPFAIVAQ